MKEKVNLLTIEKIIYKEEKQQIFAVRSRLENQISTKKI